MVKMNEKNTHVLQINKDISFIKYFYLLISIVELNGEFENEKKK